MSRALVIDVYRFCTLVHELLRYDCKVLITNNRFLIPRISAERPDIVTFAESKGIKMPAANYDNEPLDADKAPGCIALVRSSLGARRTEHAAKHYDEVYLGCMFNLNLYVGMHFDKVYYDDLMDEYCADLIAGTRERDPDIERMYILTARSKATAEFCFSKPAGASKIRVYPETDLGLLQAVYEA